MTIRVEAHRSLEAAAHLGPCIDALNLASRRPTPFGTLAFAKAFLDHDEFAEPRTQPLLLAAHREEELVGFLALRRRPQKLLGVPGTKIEFLLTHDVDQLGMAVRPEDETECAEAFWRHLVERERGWSFLELQEQPLDSPLLPPAWVSRRGFRVRRFENNPSATLRLEHADAAGYFASLSDNQRRSVRHTTNRLLRHGELEVVSAHDPRSRLPLLEAYLDVEARSWKAGTRAGIARHPERLAFFRSLSRPDEVPALWYHFLVLDGLPIAAEMNATFGGDEYGFEVAHDDEHRDLGAANLLFFLSVADAIGRGRRSFHLMTNFAWQKQRWGATITDTAAIQVFRSLRLFDLKARLGELRRRVARAAPSQRQASVNLSKPAVERGPAAVRSPRAEERRRWEEILSSLERDGVPFERRRGDALLAALPFRQSRKAG